MLLNRCKCHSTSLTLLWWDIYDYRQSLLFLTDDNSLLMWSMLTSFSTPPPTPLKLWWWGKQPRQSSQRCLALSVWVPRLLCCRVPTVHSQFWSWLQEGLPLFCILPKKRTAYYCLMLYNNLFHFLHGDLLKKQTNQRLSFLEGNEVDTVTIWGTCYN